jgi:hypothetical protein
MVAGVLWIQTAWVLAVQDSTTLLTRYVEGHCTESRIHQRVELGPRDDKTTCNEMGCVGLEVPPLLSLLTSTLTSILLDPLGHRLNRMDCSVQLLSSFGVSRLSVDVHLYICLLFTDVCSRHTTRNIRLYWFKRYFSTYKRDSKRIIRYSNARV